MKLQKKKNRTFQNKIICYNLIVVVCIAAAISLYNYNMYRKDAEQNTIENSNVGIRILSDRLDLAYNEMVNLVLNCAERKALFFATRINQYNENEPYMALYSSSVLNDLCAVSGYNQYIYKITLYYKDKLLLQSGTQSGSFDDVESIQNAPWFEDRLNRSVFQYALSIQDNPFPLGKFYTPKILPLLRPLQYNHSDNPEDAWVFLGISPRLYEDALHTMSPGQILYAMTGDGDIIASQNGNQFDVQELIQQVLSTSEANGHFTTKINAEPCVVTYRKHDVSGITLFEILPSSTMAMDHNVIWSTILLTFFFCIAIGLVLSYLISHLLGAPISKLNKRLELISEGNFELDSSIETNDEIGMIGERINHMSHHISNLLDNRIKDEKEKKDMEIKMLQAQINPHFLYNTLDSIKWIATIQKNTGIVQVVTALSSLLKNMAKGFNEKVSIRQELDFLQNYVIIEKIRYIELFDVEIDVDSPELYEARIIKLTLQPLVENAIFSGIEPSGHTGIIKIHVFTKNGILYVTVMDNGIGISEENIAKILTDTSRVTRNNMSGIGLPNVDRRLKLVYGEDYGLVIESEPDQYTKITISLPLEMQ